MSRTRTVGYLFVRDSDIMLTASDIRLGLRTTDGPDLPPPGLGMILERCPVAQPACRLMEDDPEEYERRMKWYCERAEMRLPLFQESW